MIWDGRWEGGSGLGTHVHPWLIHINVWQNQYSIVKQNKVKIKIKKLQGLNSGFANYSVTLTKSLNLCVSFPTSKMVITGKNLGELVETAAFFLNLPEFENKIKKIRNN